MSIEIGGDTMNKMPWWYILIDWITRIIIAIVVPIIVVAIVRHMSVLEVAKLLLERLSMLPQMKL